MRIKNIIQTVQKSSMFVATTCSLAILFPFMPKKVIGLFNVNIINTNVHNTEKNRDKLQELIKTKGLSEYLFEKGVYRSSVDHDYLSVWFKNKEAVMLFVLKVGDGQSLVDAVSNYTLDADS